MKLRFELLSQSMVVVFPALILLLPMRAEAFSSGPEDERTGAPGELTCTQCHSSFPLNSGSGTLSLLGAPDSYQPSETYRLSVSLVDPSAQRWGFELTSLDAANDPAGDLANIGTITQTSTAANGREYIKHTLSGTAFGTTGSHQWDFAWTAPDSGTGAVTFWFAGNAANGDFTNLGDRIYNASVTLEEATATSVPVALAPVRLLPSAPNPFNPRTQLRFELDRGGELLLEIVDTRGRQVRTLSRGWRAAGAHAVTWDGRDDLGLELGSGSYYVRLVAADHVLGQTVTLLK